jgi:hypothetical protein
MPQAGAFWPPVDTLEAKTDNFFVSFLDPQ